MAAEGWKAVASARNKTPHPCGCGEQTVALYATPGGYRFKTVVSNRILPRPVPPFGFPNDPFGRIEITSPRQGLRLLFDPETPPARQRLMAEEVRRIRLRRDGCWARASAAPTRFPPAEAWPERKYALLRALPALRVELYAAGSPRSAADLQAEELERLTRDSLGRLARTTGDLLVRLVESTELAVLVLAAILKRGLTSLLPLDGTSPLEAELGFEPFEVRLAPASVAATSVDGEVSEAFDLDPARFLARLGKLPAHLAVLTEFGDELWPVLFRNQVRDHFERCLGRARAHGLGVRIQLRVDDPRWAAVPWELARYPASGEFLAVSDQLLLVRTVAARNHRSLRTPANPAVIVAVAQPAGLPEADADTELSNVRRLGERHGLAVHTIAGATARQVREGIEGTPAHLFHFIGHGVFLAGQGYLLLEHPTAKYEQYSGERLAHLLQAQPTIEVVFLNTCQGAVSDDHRAFHGLAPRLVQAGLPVVVAMQDRISNKPALLFSEVFYRFIGRGFSPAFAVQKGRQALFNDLREGTRDFAKPVVFATA